MGSQRKDLNYYLGLPYEVLTEPIPDNVGGGFDASIPLLGKFSVHSWGATKEDAIAQLAVVKQERLIDYISEGVDIPEP